MKTSRVLGATAVFLLVIGLGSAHGQVAPLPGSPLQPINFGTLDLTAGGALLPGTVVPGDVLLRESPTGGNGLNNASDVVRFTNIDLSSVGLPGISVGMAFLISDLNVVPRPDLSIAINNGAGGAPFLPSTLAANTVFLNEIQSGTGTNLDVTPYQATGALYNIHSDAASTPPDVSDVVTLLPGAPIGGGNQLVLLGEAGTMIGALPLNFRAVDGMDDVAEPGGAGAISDTLVWATNPVTGVTTVSGFSDPPANDMDMGQMDIEIVPGGSGDAPFATYLIASSEAQTVPEPGTLLLLGSGLLATLSYSFRWRKPRA
jgi:PEP-CTERM motif